MPAWLDALRPGGRLVFPLTSERLGGFMLRVTRGDAADWLTVSLLCRAWFIPFIGARDADLDNRLAAQIAAGHADLVRSLRRDVHEPDESCWLHGDGFCLSCRDTRPARARLIGKPREKRQAAAPWVGGSMTQYHAGRHFLQIPGPTNVPDRVLRAIDNADHRPSRPGFRPPGRWKS